MRIPAFLGALSALTITLATATASAQENKPAAQAVMPAASMPMMDCGSGMKRHDHGAERNAPSARSMPCAPDAAASGAKSKAKAKPTHDHAEFHKNQ